MGSSSVVLKSELYLIKCNFHPIRLWDIVCHYNQLNNSLHNVGRVQALHSSAVCGPCVHSSAECGPSKVHVYCHQNQISILRPFLFSDSVFAEKDFNVLPYMLAFILTYKYRFHSHEAPEACSNYWRMEWRLCSFLVSLPHAGLKNAMHGAKK